MSPTSQNDGRSIPPQYVADGNEERLRFLAWALSCNPRGAQRERYLAELEGRSVEPPKKEKEQP